MTTLAEWHAARNAETAATHADRASRFGLRPVPSDDEPAVIRRLSGRTVWAWQPATPLHNDDAPGTVRVGVAGRRLHLGHLGLARDVAWLQEKGHALAFVGLPGRSAESGATVRTLVERIKQFGGHEPMQSMDLDAPDARVFEERVLTALTMGRMQQVYGWSAATSLRLLQDAVVMMGFFLHKIGDRPTVALVDAGQIAHTALLRTVARRLKMPTPYVAYRRLLPDLRATASRATAHHPESTIFLDEPKATAYRKFMAAATGGRPSVEEQRAHGGDPTACPAFEVIELLCPPERAAEAARRCQAGDLLCRECKAKHADEVVAAIRCEDLPRLVPRAGTSEAVPAALLDVAPALHRPPPLSPAGLEAAIARYAGVDPEQVVVGNGTTEILDWLMREQESHGRAVLTTTPTFELYGHLAARHGLRHDSVAWDDRSLGHDRDRLGAAVTSEHAAVVVDLPHTVSGTSLPLSDLLATVAPRLSVGAKLIIDNVYGEYMAHPVAVTPELLEERGELVVCRSLSKAHCLLGARVGYALTSAAYAARLRRHQLPYGVSSLAAAAARTSLRDAEGLRRNLSANRQAYGILTAELDRLDLRYVPTDANFLLIDLGAQREQVLAVLRACGLRFRDGTRWQLTSMIQVHLIDEATVAPLVRALRALR